MNFMYKTHLIDYDYSFINSTKTLLLLHGWGGNKDSFIRLKQIFKSQYNILSLTMPPFDDSIVSLDMYDYKQLLLNLLNSLNISSASIVCHSFGMRVSLMLSTCFDIEKIVITGGAGIRLKQNLFQKLTSNFRLIFLPKHPDHFKFFASTDYVNLSNINRKTFKNIVNKDLTNYIKFIKCPTLLFWGKKDTATPIKMFKIFKKLKPNIEYKIINLGTHFCYLEHYELFIDYCQNFLS